MRQSILWGLFLVLPACGGLKKPTAPSGTLDLTMAQSFKESNSRSLFTYGNPFTSDIAGAAVGQSRRAIDIASCTTKTNFTDGTDVDAIPSNGSFVVNCPDLTFGSGTMAITGKGAIVDKNDAAKAPLGGFKSTLSDFLITIKSDSFSVDTTVNGFSDLTDNGSGSTFAFSSEMVFSATATAGGKTLSTDVGYWSDMKLTPTDPANALTAGTVDEITLWFTSKAAQSDYTIKGTCANLTYKTATSGFFDSGTCEFVAGGTQKIEATFTAGTAAWKFDGAAIDSRDKLTTYPPK